MCRKSREGRAWGGLHLYDSGTELFIRNILDILEIWYTKAYAGELHAHHDETPSELDTAQGEPLTTQKARDEDFLLNADNDDMSYDTNTNASKNID